MNLQAIANALFEASAEFKNVKRNKSGSINGNAAGAIRNRLAKKLQGAGESYSDSWSLAWDLSNSFK